MKNKTSRGGARPGAGRPREIKDPVTVNFSVERKYLESAKKKHPRSLNAMFREWLKSIA